MRKLCSFVLPSLVIILAALASWRLTVSRSDETIPGAGPRAQFAPYYTLTQGFRAMLMLNNSTGAAFVVKPTVYSLQGKAVEMQPLRLEAHDRKEIDLALWVTGLGEEYTSGSLRLDYVSVGFGLGAMVMMTNERDSLELNVLARSPQMYKSSRLEAMWWAPDHKSRVWVAVQNTTDQNLKASLVLTRADGTELQYWPVLLAVHETRLFDLREILADDDGSLGGVSIRHDGQPGAVMAQVFSTDPTTGFSANLPLEDPALAGDSRLEGAGVFIGSEGQSPTLVYSGHLLLRNISGVPVAATPVLQRGTSRKTLRTTRLASGEAREILVPSGALPNTGEAAGVEVSYTGTSGGLLAYWFSVDSAGNLVVETPLRSPASKVPRGGNNPWTIEGDFSSVLYVKNTGEQPGHFVGSIWHRGGQYTMGLKEVPPGQTLAIDLRELRDQQVPDVTGRRLPRELLAGQAVWVWHDGPPLVGRVNTMSVSKGIARNMSCGICCCNPRSVTISLSPGSFVGPVGGTFQETPWETDVSCSAQTTYPLSPGSVAWSSSAPNVAPVDSFGVVSCTSPGTAQITGTGSAIVSSPQPRECNIAPCECLCNDTIIEPVGSGGVTVVPRIDSISPSRGPIGLTVSVTISGRGFGTSPTVSPGTGISVTVTSASDTQIGANFAIAATAPSGNHSVTVTAGGQPSNSVNFFVQVPTSLSIAPGTDSTTSEASCSAGSAGTGCGVTRSFVYQVNDQTGQPIQAAGLELWDEIRTTSPDNLAITGYVTTCSPANTGPCGVTTNSLGQFAERLPVCSTICRVNNVCTTGGPTNASQTVHVGSSTITQSLSYYCDRVTVNGQ